MEVEKSLRYRINIATSVKGVKTWECTVDFEQSTNSMPANEAIKSMNETLELSDKLVKELESRYPPPIEK